MRYFSFLPIRFISGLFFLFLFSSCATLDKTSINNLDRVAFEPLVLKPGFDLYEMRLDIIRQEKTTRNHDSIFSDKKAAYRTLGFYLGNGLFFDINGNISLLVPQVMEVYEPADFTIEELNSRGKIRRTYQRSDNSFFVEFHGLIPVNKRAEIEITDSLLSIDRGFLNRQSLLITDSALYYKGFLRSETIHAVDQGYEIPGLFSRKKFMQDGDRIFLDKKYLVCRQRDEIVIYQRNLFGRYRRKYTMVRSASDIYIFSRKNKGLKVSLTDNELIVEKNQSFYRHYIIKE